MLSALRSAQSAFDRIRDREFSRLDENGDVYLDYTGSALYGESQLRSHMDLLQKSLFGNPHSDSIPSRASTKVIEDVREQTLRFFGVNPSTHAVCFTANASAAIKLVAESYPFRKNSNLILTADNHNSVNGIREYARRAGASLSTIPIDTSAEGGMRLQSPGGILERVTGGGLFAFPAQSNFSGVQHPLSLVCDAHRRGLDVLLDAASFVGSSPLDLSRCEADYTVLSFYKIFGYPTGLGALIVRREALAKLERPWFAGGTVLYASVAADTHRLRPSAEAFEDGTPDFLSIAAVPAGFDLIEEIGLGRIAAHVKTVTAMMIEDLQALRHRDGSPVVTIIGPTSSSLRGGTVAFNVLTRDGRTVDCEDVESRARESRVAVRAGCFCNPGASEAAFGMDADAIERCLDETGVDFNVARYRECSGRPLGAVRASAGVATNAADIARLIDVIATWCE